MGDGFMIVAFHIFRVAKPSPSGFKFHLLKFRPTHRRTQDGVWTRSPSYRKHTIPDPIPVPRSLLPGHRDRVSGHYRVAIFNSGLSQSAVTLAC